LWYVAVFGAGLVIGGYFAVALLYFIIVNKVANFCAGYMRMSIKICLRTEYANSVV
jgi:esterase/lipase